MALPNLPQQITINQYIAGGAQTNFNVNFYIPPNAQTPAQFNALVYLYDPVGLNVYPQTYLSNFTYAPSADPTTGGIITFIVAPTAGFVVTIDRDVQAQYSYNFAVAQTISGDNMNGAFINDVLVGQQNNTNFVNRSLKYPAYVYIPAQVGTDPTTIPLLGANQVWAGAPSGNNVVIATTIEEGPDTSLLRSQLLSEANGGDGASIVGCYIPNIGGETVTEALTTLYGSQQSGAQGRLPNSSFWMWSYGDSFTIAANQSVIFADKWRLTASSIAGTTTISQVLYSEIGPVPQNMYSGSKFLMDLSHVAGTGGTLTQEHSIYGALSYSGQTITYSFAAYSEANLPNTAILWYQNFGTGGSPSANIQTLVGSVNIESGYNIYSVTFAVPSAVGVTLGTNANDTSRIQIVMPDTANNMYFFWDNIDSGSQLGTYIGKSLGVEQADCQAFRRSSYQNGQGGYVALTNGTLIQPVWAGVYNANGGGVVNFNDMVIAPTVQIYSFANGTNGSVTILNTGGTTHDVGSVVIVATTTNSFSYTLAAASLDANDVSAAFNYIADTGIF